MDSDLSKVAGLAVWGSLSATLILGAFFLVQTAVDRPRRAPFALFSLVMAYLGVLDLIQAHSGFDPLTYEWLRLWWGGAYAGCALWLLGNSRRTAFGVAATLLIAGFSAFRWGNPALATTLTFPFAFGATSVGFGRRYLA